MNDSQTPSINGQTNWPSVCFPWYWISGLTFNADDVLPNLLSQQWIWNQLDQVVNGVDRGMNRLESLDFMPNRHRSRLILSGNNHLALGTLSVICLAAGARTGTGQVQDLSNLSAGLLRLSTAQECGQAHGGNGRRGGPASSRRSLHVFDLQFHLSFLSQNSAIRVESDLKTVEHFTSKQTLNPGLGIDVSILELSAREAGGEPVVSYGTSVLLASKLLELNFVRSQVKPCSSWKMEIFSSVRRSPLCTKIFFSAAALRYYWCDYTKPSVKQPKTTKKRQNYLALYTL